MGRAMIMSVMQDTAGNIKESSSKSEPSQDIVKIDWTKLLLSDLAPLKFIGKGSFGRVTLAQHCPSKRLVALKSVLKADLASAGDSFRSSSEGDILKRLEHPFLIKLFATLQDAGSIYFVTEYVPGGNFQQQLNTHGQLSERIVRFYSAEIVLALEYLHKNNIMYRDLKPENMMLDMDGHLKLVDFGLAKHLSQGQRRTWTQCGTAEYTAPEIVLNQGHSVAVDWWSLGVVMYEMLAGYTPFNGLEPYEIYHNIIQHGIMKFPACMSHSCRDLIKKLLETDVSKRLGAREIRSHSFFRNIDFTALKTKKTKATN